MSGDVPIVVDKTKSIGLCSLCSQRVRDTSAPSQTVLNAILQSIRELQEANRHLLTRVEHIHTTINGTTAARQIPAGDPVIRKGGMIINIRSRSATLDGRELHLTSTEFDVLAKLVSSAPAVVPVAEMTAALGYQPLQKAEGIGQWHIHNLRKKLGRKRIRTVYGQGYLWVG
jgi:DNA-binding response OmpR family regulator